MSSHNVEDDKSDAERYRFIKQYGCPKPTRAVDGSRLWYMDRVSDNVEMVDSTFNGCIDKARGVKDGAAK